MLGRRLDHVAANNTNLIEKNRELRHRPDLKMEALHQKIGKLESLASEAVFWIGLFDEGYEEKCTELEKELEKIW